VDGWTGWMDAVGEWEMGGRVDRWKYRRRLCQL
jgi:hypothetical protein